MIEILNLLFLIIIIFVINKFLIKKSFLISYSGENHQKFASNYKVPLSGGIFIFLSFIFILEKEFLYFLFFIFILGIFSDLKLINSASKRLLFQISIVLLSVLFFDLQLSNTKVHLLDNLLENSLFNYLFVTFCILIVINGSNFLDGLNTLNIFYFTSILIIIKFLNYSYSYDIQNLNLNYIIYSMLILFILNLFNKIYLGDSGTYLIGFFISIFLINFYLNNELISPFFIILLLWYPCYETLFSIIRKNIMKQSPMYPDSNHLHQQIFFNLKKKFKLEKLNANILSAIIINIYNLLIFTVSLNFLSNSQIQILMILLNICIYTLTYFKLYVLRYKKL